MSTKSKQRQELIFEFVNNNQTASSSEIYATIPNIGELITVKRVLSEMVVNGMLEIKGVGRSTVYRVNKSYHILKFIDIDIYYKTNSAVRKVKTSYDFDLFNVLQEINLFNNSEQSHLSELHKSYRKNIETLPEEIRRKEFERLAIDLIWKSSEIEGNTYSLLETEQLIKEQKETIGKTKEEATMLLNHKRTIDFIVREPSYITPISVSKIESIHQLLIEGLGVDKNLRTRAVGITGTSFKPLDNQHQIREALEKMCELINDQGDCYSKALLALCLISYIQPFNDGNKRTGRIVSNAILMHDGICPLSYRTIEAIDYKKAMLLFYEQNNISAMKSVFMEQYEFAVTNYFA